MRLGHGGGILRDKHGTLLGVSLGADYCAEHEWGIKGTLRILGIPGTTEPENWGLKGRQMTRGGERVRGFDVSGSYFAKDGDRKSSKATWWGFVLKEYGYGDLDKPVRVPMDLANPYADFMAAWSDGDFGVISCKENEIKALREILAAFQTNDIAVGLFDGGVFENPGLKIAIASRIPEEVRTQWYEADKARWELERDVAAMGILQKLAAAGKGPYKGYFACSPNRQRDGSIKFWLSPYDQDNNNYGWYTEADLLAWIDGKGPIPMTAAPQKAERRRQ